MTGDRGGERIFSSLVGSMCREAQLPEGSEWGKGCEGLTSLHQGLCILMGCFLEVGLSPNRPHPKACPCGNVRLSPRHLPSPSRTLGPLSCLPALEPQSINWQVTSNRQAHRTDRFSGQQLTVRRGQPFSFSMILNRSLDSRDSLGFVASTGTCSPLPHARGAVLPRVRWCHTGPLGSGS